MGWAEIIGLIVQVGLPAAEKLIGYWTSNTPATPENVTAALAEARALGAKTPEGIVKGLLASKGIAETDPRAIQVLQLLTGA